MFGHLVINNFLFHRIGRIRLFDSDREPFKERLVQNISTNKATIIGTLSFGIRSSNNSKAFNRMNPLTNLFEIDTWSLKDRLQCHDLVRCKVDLIKEKNCTTFHSSHYRAIMPDCLTIKQTKTTNQIILICFYSNIRTDIFTLQFGAYFLYH